MAYIGYRMTTPPLSEFIYCGICNIVPYVFEWLWFLPLLDLLCTLLVLLTTTFWQPVLTGIHQRCVGTCAWLACFGVPFLFLTCENDSMTGSVHFGRPAAGASIPRLDLLLNPPVWMRGSDLAHLRCGALMPYYPWAVVKLLKTPLPPFKGGHNSHWGYRDVKIEIDLRKKPEKTWAR